MTHYWQYMLFLLLNSEEDPFLKIYLLAIGWNSSRPNLPPMTDNYFLRKGSSSLHCLAAETTWIVSSGQLMTANLWQLMTVLQLLTAYSIFWQHMKAFVSFWQLWTAYNIFWHFFTASEWGKFQALCTEQLLRPCLRACFLSCKLLISH
mgnify:CR=1 FL=1